jgi:hypothetical protein
MEGIAMTQATDSFLDHFIGAILPSQYADLVRRRSAGFEAERRLLWAVLQDAIYSYLANMACTTARQREEFEEICGWFRPPTLQPGGLFSFETICEQLEIDPRLLLKGLESIREKETHAATRPSSPPPRAAIRRRRLAA